jgi:hypothetical protein
MNHTSTRRPARRHSLALRQPGAPATALTEVPIVRRPQAGASSGGLARSMPQTVALSYQANIPAHVETAQSDPEYVSKGQANQHTDSACHPKHHPLLTSVPPALTRPIAVGTALLS